jgi:hypothetical protein
LLGDAARHLRSSRAIAGDDPEGAYALLYDAARKAVDAHMSAAGYRASKVRPGSHEAIALYAREVFAGEYLDDGRALDRMRKQRNKAEYQAWHISAGRLAGDLVHADRLVEAVRRELGL